MDDFGHKIKELLKEQKTGVYEIKNLNLLKTIKWKHEYPFDDALDSFVYFIDEKPVLIINKITFIVSKLKVEHIRIIKSIAILQNGDCYFIEKNKKLRKIFITDKDIGVFGAFKGKLAFLNADEIFPVLICNSDAKCVRYSSDILRLFFKEGKEEDILEFNRLYNTYKNEIDTRKIAKNKKTNSYWLKSTCFLSKVEDYLCFQFFTYNKKNTKFFETSRIYISKNRVISAKINFMQKLVVTKEIFFANADNIYIDKNVENSIYKYIEKDAKKLMKLSDWSNKKHSLANILQLLCGIPFFEKLVKEGLEEPLVDFINHIGYSTYESIINAFDERIFEQPNITPKKFYGINEYQKSFFKRTKINTSINSIIKSSKFLLETNNIAFISNNQSDILFTYFNTYFYETYKINFRPVCSCGDSDAIDMDDMKYIYKNFSNNLLFKILKMYNTVNKTKHLRRLDNYFVDYLHMAIKLHANGFKNIFEIFPVNIENFSYIKKIHDDITVFYNNFESKENDVKFNGYTVKMEEYLFEDKNYKIVIPKSTYELKKEGLALHNCLGSYCDRVLLGKTNILFIRKQKDIDKPFFAAEISNTGEIKQVHGFANKNASSEWGLTDFIRKWSKEKNLTCSV